MSEIRILCIHGIGHQEANIDGWQPQWNTAIANCVKRWNSDISALTDYLEYDDLFATAPMTVGNTLEGFGKLLLNEVVYGVGDIFHRHRGFGDVSEKTKWYAGMVTQWADDAKLREKLRNRLADKITKFDPHVICAHSLGSLICYDLFVHPPQNSAAEGRFLMTFGSQIGNPAVRGNYGGRIIGVAALFWYNLYNKNDDVFTVSLAVPSNQYMQIEATFDLPGAGDHDAIFYLTHPNTVNKAWREIAGARRSRALTRAAAPTTPKAEAAEVKLERIIPKPTPRRALLIGINDYPQEENRLEGCVNDVFLMSSVLQEAGFDADDIRVVLNERATANGIRERLEWLLEDPRPGDTRVLFYSGHGAQIPGYGIDETVDRLDECLVPYDFDWSRDTAITDDNFFDLYSQLPYEAHFVAIFDCCHSGGMTRLGGLKVRGISPPDDIRHRMLRWDSEEEMWVERKVEQLNPDLADLPEFTGKSRATRRLGRAISLRTLPTKRYDKVREDLGHHGPYLPMLYEACAEQEFSYEYRDGATSYGAFTYCLTQALRKAGHAGRTMNFQELRDEIAQKLQRLQYTQTPALLGPTALLESKVPWRPSTLKKRPRRRQKI